MIHSAAAIQIPQIIISDDRHNSKNFDFLLSPVARREGSDDEDETAPAYSDYEIDDDDDDDDNDDVPTPRRRYLRADHVR